MTWYKFLAPGAVGAFSGFTWPTPHAADRPGAWVMAPGQLEPCRVGLHVCRPADLPFWMLDELYAVEVDGLVLEYDGFVLTRRARLVRRVEPWGQERASAFSSDCVWRVRDLLVAALHDAGRDEEAHVVDGCGTVSELLEAGERLPCDGEQTGRLLAYLQDAARYALATGSDSRWPAHAATVAFIAATAMRAAAGQERGERAGAAERARQADWLTEHVLVAV